MPVTLFGLAAGVAALTALGVGDARASSDPFAALPSGAVPIVAAAAPPASIEHGWGDGLELRVPYRRDRRLLQATDGRCLGLVSAAGAEAASRPTQATIWLAPKPGVIQLRSERLVRDASGARLELSDLWIDPETASVREFFSATVPLAMLAGHASGFAAYGFRDGNAVEIVVTTHGAFQFTSATGELDSNDCDHARVRLDASVVGGDDVVVVGRYDEREAPHTLAPSTTEPDPPLRMWTAQMSASASRTKSDPAAVLSLTMRVSEFVPARGWRGGM